MTNLTLAGRFLLALPRLKGDFFADTVSLLIEHTEHGSFGLMINRPTDLTLAQALDRDELGHIPVYMGGPVEPERLFFIHGADREYEGSFPVNDQVVLSTDPQLIEDIAAGDPPSRLLALVGYAGWGEGQLEQEIGDEVWVTAPFDSEVLFDVAPGDRLKHLADKLGVDLNLIRTDSQRH